MNLLDSTQYNPNYQNPQGDRFIQYLSGVEDGDVVRVTYTALHTEESLPAEHIGVVANWALIHLYEQLQKQYENDPNEYKKYKEIIEEYKEITYQQSKCWNYDDRCAGITNACEFREWFNLYHLPETPQVDKTINQHIVKACLQLYKDTGRVESTQPAGMALEWKESQLQAAYCSILPYLNVFARQGQASVAVDKDMFYLDPQQVQAQQENAKCRYDELVCRLKIKEDTKCYEGNQFRYFKV